RRDRAVTAVVDAPAAAPEEAAPEPTDSAPVPASTSDGPVEPPSTPGYLVFRSLSGALSLLLLLVLGLLGHAFGLSNLSEHRAQVTMLADFAYALDQAVAPTGPTTEGAAVAVLDIPEIGLDSAVVVEGTSSRDMMNGPGHRPDTVLPGQAGVSVIYGKRATFG